MFSLSLLKLVLYAREYNLQEWEWEGRQTGKQLQQIFKQGTSGSRDIHHINIVFV
jgi:hypothetical protein